MAGTEAIAPGAVIDGRYKLLSHLGTGGFGLVYQATQLNTGQLVAVKIARHYEIQGGSSSSSSGPVERFKREMEVVAQLSHPNIVRLVDAGQLPDGRLFAVLQLVQGMSLAELLYHEGPTDPVETQHLMVQVLDALCSAHDLGVIHRDLKPANIMVTHVGARRNALVLDFGIATFVKSVRDDAYKSLTPDGTVGGTPAYMAPEQLHGRAANPQTDLYAWGLVFLECLTGQRVIRGATVAQDMFLHLRPEPHQIPPMISSHPVGQVLKRALAKNATQRYQSARDALAELVACDLSRLPRMPRSEYGPDGTLHHALTTADPYAQTHGSTYLAHTGIEPGPPTEAASAPTFTDITTRTALSPQWRGRQSSTSITQSVVAERRQLTALVCELVPLATLSEHLSADELYELLSQFRRIVEGQVYALEGMIQRADGGRAQCYFGSPVAHEDDASRAVQAALEIRRLVHEADWALPASVAKLTVSAAVHSGLVVTSSSNLGQTDEIAIVGDVSRMAARLQEGTPPGQIIISHPVYQLVRDRFDSVTIGNRTVSSEQQVPAYRVLGPAEAISRLGTTTAPLIGRDSELSTLLDRWDEVCDGRGQVALIPGEIGIGKSHLARAFRARIEHMPHIWLDCRSSPYLSTSAFHPIIHALQRLFWIRSDEPAAVGRRRVRQFLDLHRVAIDQLDELLFALLGIDDASSTQPVRPARDLFRQPAEERLLDFIFALADYSPLFIRFEDLQWTDPSSRELLRRLVDQVPLSPVFLLATTRPSFSPEWQNRSHVTRLQLTRLSRRRVMAMIRSVAGERVIPEPLVEHLAVKTDGVPLFVEELTKVVLDLPRSEDSDGWDLPVDLSSLTIPESLRGSLMARLDRLGPAKEVAQIASVIGREFSFKLLASISDVPALELGHALDQLVHAELVVQRGRPPNARYVFKHGLTQDTAYESLLDKTRRHYHARIAEALEHSFPDIATAQPELVAHHCTEARLEAAVSWWSRAGTRAAERSAHVESAQHFQRGLALLSEQPSSAARRDRELTLTMGLGSSLIATKGYGSEEVEQTFSRVLELCREAAQEPRPGSERDRATTDKSAADSHADADADSHASDHSDDAGLKRSASDHSAIPSSADSADTTRATTYDQRADTDATDDRDDRDDNDAARAATYDAADAAANDNDEQHTKTLVSALWGLWLFYQVRAKYAQALEVGSQLYVLAESSGDTEIYLCAHQALGASLFLTGDLAAAERHFESGVTLYDPAEHRRMAVLYAQDPGIFCRVFLARLQCMHGSVDRARAAVDAVIADARVGEHPHSIAFALCMTQTVLLQRGETDDSMRLADEAIEVAGTYRLVHWLAFARFMHGTARAQSGAAHADDDQLTAGIAEMEHALAEWRAAGGRASLPYLHALMAEQLSRADRFDDALATLDQVPATNYERSEHLYESTWQRTYGRVLIRRGDPDDRQRAGRCFTDAAASARRRGDVLEELAAWTDLLAFDPEGGTARVTQPPGVTPAARVRALLASVETERELPLVRAAEHALASSR
ncbi:MAG: hypothetical protein Tsb0020_14410 [Haliangiales bacterium]